MEDHETAIPAASKKRVAGTQLTKDTPDPDDDGASEPELQTFERASEEVMATRRIVKVRRHQQPLAASSNPFASICLVPPTDSSVKSSSPSDQLQLSGDITILHEQNNAGERTSEANGTETAAILSDTDQKEKTAGTFDDSTNEPVSKEGSPNVIQEASQSVKTNEKLEEGGEQTVDESVEAIEKEDTKEEAGETSEKEDTNKQARETSEKGNTVKECGDATEAKEGEDRLDNKDADQEEKPKMAFPLSAFQQLSGSQNAFTGLAGTGFSVTAFSFGVKGTEGSAFTSSGSLFGLKSDKPSRPSFGLGSTLNGSLSSSSVLGTTSTEASRGGVLPMKEVPVETGEESEKAVFTADAIMYEYIDTAWKERGRGELKMNISVSGGQRARLIMRTKGNYRLILNASLYPDMALKDMDKRGVTFTCVNSAGEGKDGITTLALKFKDSNVRDEFSKVVARHKGEKAPAPGNSPQGV